MKFRAKQTVLLCLVAALISLLLLATSLSELELQLGLPFPAGEDTSPLSRNLPSISATQPNSVPLLEIILGVVLIALMIYVPARLISLANIRKVLALVVGAVLLVALLSILPRILPAQSTSRARDRLGLTTPRPSDHPPIVTSGQPPQVVLWLAAGCFLLGAGLLATRLLRHTPESELPTEAVSQTARNALHDLSAGGDFSRVIIACYLQMAEVLRAERKLERRHTMTAREFQDWLGQKGIPADPVHRLTFLFEKARYGDEPMSQLDQNAGKECLMQIIQYCRKESTESKWTGS